MAVAAALDGGVSDAGADAGDATPGYPAPYDRCMAAFNGHAFSAQLTDDERRRGDHGTCCYLDRCQISYGY